MVLTWMSLYIGAMTYVYIAGAIMLAIMAYNLKRV
jgi:hypothetical protein